MNNLYLITALTLTLTLSGCRVVDRHVNAVTPISRTGQASSEAQAFHQSLFIGDLHTDSLIWPRDLSKRHSYGHLDVPRMVEGNIAFQLFTVPTERPFRLGNWEIGNSIGLLQSQQKRGLRTNFDRANLAADRLDQLVEDTAKLGQPLIKITSAESLQRFLTARRNHPSDKNRPIAVMLGLEGAHGVEDGFKRNNGWQQRELTNLGKLYARGYRTVSPCHFHRNHVAGSAQGLPHHNIGLTDHGRELAKTADKLGMFIDMAHTSPDGMNDLIAMHTAGELTRPLINTHTGIKPYMPARRAIQDQHIIGIAKTGGLIGIAFFKSSRKAMPLTDVARSMRQVEDLLDTAGLNGIDHISLGSDFDGSVTVPIDASQLSLLTEELLKPEHGFSRSDIRKIMGENLLRVLRIHLP